MVIGARIETEIDGELVIEHFDTELQCQEAFDKQVSFPLSGTRKLKPEYSEHRPEVYAGVKRLVVRVKTNTSHQMNCTRRELYILK